MHLNTCKRKPQLGAVLFTGLIILAVLSLVAVTSMQSATLEQRMAGNTKDEFIAFEAAEAALAAAETLLASGTLTQTNFKVNDADGLYENQSDKIHQDIDWSTQAINVPGFDPDEVTTPPCLSFNISLKLLHLAQTAAFVMKATASQVLLPLAMPCNYFVSPRVVPEAVTPP